MKSEARQNEINNGREADLRTMLEARHRELVADLHERVKSVRNKLELSDGTGVVDAAEWAEADIQEELHFSLMQLKAETLQRVEEALSRLAAGHFGWCADCDGEISERRLRALPFALRCTTCEQAHEDAAARSSRSVTPRFPGALFQAQ